MIKFILHVGQDNPDYYNIVVFDNRESLINDLGSIDCEAITHSYVAYLGKQKSHNVGTIGFHQGHISPEIVSHEMVHAANHYWKNQYRKWNIGHKDKYWATEDELHATLVGYLVKNFYKEYNHARFGLK